MKINVAIVSGGLLAGLIIEIGRFFVRLERIEELFGDSADNDVRRLLFQYRAHLLGDCVHSLDFPLVRNGKLGDRCNFAGVELSFQGRVDVYL